MYLSSFACTQYLSTFLKCTQYLSTFEPCTQYLNTLKVLNGQVGNKWATQSNNSILYAWPSKTKKP